jgi:hypothetical protein
MAKFSKLPSEEFLPPVTKFNDTVGPLFAELHHLFPLNEHRYSGLSRSLGIFLNYVFTESMQQLEALRPAQLSREEWTTASKEMKQTHLKWQSNLTYLKQRNAHFVKMLAPNVLQPKSRFDDFEVPDYDTF